MPKSAKIINAVLLICVLVFALIFLNRRNDASRLQSTDDAYVRADCPLVSPQISGRVSEVMVDENQAVLAGELLAAIDEREFALQAANAGAALAGARAARESLSVQMEQQSEIIAQARATVDADRATLELSANDYERYRNLASTGSSSEQARQQATAAYKVALANLDRDVAKHKSEVRQLEVLQAKLRQAAALSDQAAAALDLAELNLAHCRIRSPIDGVVSQKKVRLGAYVRAGEELLAVVPLRDIYIDAYFRETQLANIRPGQPVSIAVDAFPGRKFTGAVAGVGPASNASFSPLAPHSTSSNFTKIVQRLPVRITVTDADRELLKVGLSVVPTVDTGR
ncbi:MAG: HlyD family secretion protein [Candidatus Adiutrix sp.]|jgi:membrane fusion protein (multidrug efflux system)|nr:HlyD family secretion protein [Candidatus Adiutrix sp.]